MGMRDGYPTLAKMFTVLQLWSKVCVRIIDKIEHDKFILLDTHFGDLKNKIIYVTHIPWHFFLAKLIDFLICQRWQLPTVIVSSNVLFLTMPALFAAKKLCNFVN